MEAWWTSLTPLSQVYWVITIIFTLLFLLTTLMTLLSGDTDHDVGSHDGSFDMDFDDGTGLWDHLHFFSIKNMILFFAAFGWFGLGSIRSGFSLWIILLISLAAGIVAIILMSFLFLWVSKLKEEPEYHIKSTKGQTADVYLRIPGNNEGEGKVSLRIGGGLREIRAITYDRKQIDTGSKVRVIDILEDELVLVTRA